MSTGQTDARDAAADTPLTPEARVHLQAAARDVDDGAFTVGAVIRTVERAIHPDVCGEDVTLSESDAYDLARTLEGARAAMQERVVREVYARAAGDRPHGRRNGGPSVTLDREEIDALALELARIGEAACMADFKYTEDQLRTGMRAAGQKVDELTDRLYAKAGVTVDDSLLRPLHEKASRWRDGVLEGTGGDDPHEALRSRAGRPLDRHEAGLWDAARSVSLNATGALRGVNDLLRRGDLSDGQREALEAAGGALDRAREELAPLTERGGAS